VVDEIKSSAAEASQKLLLLLLYVQGGWESGNWLWSARLLTWYWVARPLKILWFTAGLHFG
jgi:hypothetical protein